MKRAVVFVDGENFRHTITKLYGGDRFDKRDYLPSNACWSDFFDRVVDLAVSDDAERVRTYWYVVEDVDPIPFILKNDMIIKEKVISWRDKNKSWLHNANELKNIENDDDSLSYASSYMKELWRKREMIKNRFEKFKNIQNNIQRSENAVEFRRSGSITYNVITEIMGEEKTVDVNLALDMVKLSNIYDVAVIVSGDQDYVPAVQAIKDYGKRVVNVAFQQSTGNLLPGGAMRLNNETDWSVSLPYEEFARYLQL